LHAGKAVDVMDFIEQHEAEDVANARDGLQQVEGIGIMLLGGFEDREFEVLEQGILIGDQVQIDRDGFLHGRRIKALGDPVAVGCVGDVLADLGEVILAVGIVPVGSQLCAFAHQMRPPPQEVTGGAPLRWRHIGLWEHAAAQQGRNLLGVDRVVFGFAAMHRFHIQGVPQDKGNLVLRAQVGEPIPGEETFHSDNQAIPVGSDDLKKGFWRGFHITVHTYFSRVAQDADIHGAGM
jgi:hypothetical protein